MEGNRGQLGQLATAKVHLGSNSSEVLLVLGCGPARCPAHGAPSSHLKPSWEELGSTDQDPKAPVHQSSPIGIRE